jgi:phosphomannomutase
MAATDLRERALAWIAGDPDETTAAELRALVDDPGEGAALELAERMAGPLAFGTAGLRGVLGAGESRMNTAVLLRTAAGLARYVLDTVPDAASRGVVVGFDGRRCSREFAAAAAAVLAAAGLPAHLFPDLTPTPLVPFAVGDLGAAAGIMITASHNPPEYNGFKVYWSNGAQITPPHDDGIAAAIARVGAARDVPRLEPSEALARGSLRPVAPALLERYLSAVAGLSLDRRGRAGLAIVYTAMHGVGDRFAREALSRYGFDRVWSVPEQQAPDGEFPTVRFPNPEEEGALDLAFALAREKHADLVLANDPDADRLAVAIPAPGGGGYRQLTGNEIGVLLGEYLLRKWTAGGDRRLVVTTVVSSPMLGEIARRAGVRYAEVLTGFKWIVTTGQAIAARDGARVLFGYEEALGYSVGTVTPDKDGISAAAIFAELTAVAASEGRSIDDELARLARAYGLWASRQVAVVKKGREGQAAIAAIMRSLRRAAPARIGDAAVVAIRDFLDPAGAPRGEGAALPRSDVVAFDLAGQARVVARPSGTEPKIKFYFDLCEPVGGEEPIALARERASARLDTLVAAFLELVG